jgi:hypothetical protein
MSLAGSCVSRSLIGSRVVAFLLRCSIIFALLCLQTSRDALSL